MRPNWLRGPFGYGTPSAFVARALARKRSSVPRLAIIVSAGGSTESLESTLVSVLEHRPPDCEILVALTGKYADPYQLQDEVRFVQAAPRTGAVAAIRDAIAASRAPFIHVLAGGCTVTEGWVEPALARFGDRNLASVAPLVLDARRPERLLAAGVGYRASGRRILVGHGQPSSAPVPPAALLGPCLFAAFYRKAALTLVDGPSAVLGPAQADIDLALALSQAGFTTALVPDARVMATAEVDGGETPFRRALHEERLFWRSLPAGRSVPAMAAHARLGHARIAAQLSAPANVRAMGRARPGLLPGGKLCAASRLAVAIEKSRGTSPRRRTRDGSAGTVSKEPRGSTLSCYSASAAAVAASSSAI